MRILLAEDDAVLSGVMCKSLGAAGHRVDVVDTLAHLRLLWREQAFDAVLLDLQLADGPGLHALREARHRGDATPVLVLTARNATEERIAGLDAGADDYLGKPFDLAEVEARLRALARRAQATRDEVELGVLRLDRLARRFYLAGQPLDMPAREFDVLWELMTPPGRVVNKRMLSNKLSALEDALGDNALEVFISRLRKRLAGSGVAIRTLRGLGYLVEQEAAAADATPGAA